MVSKVLKVFYGEDYLPYKDSERTIHFPVGGNTFAGTQNTFRICFYPRDLVGSNDLVEQTSWVLVSKLPNGRLGYELLNTIETDSELGEKYIVFDLSSYYSQFKGVVKLAIRGYQGEIEFTDLDDEGNELPDGAYRVIGTPIIGVTGTIDIAINYSPMVYGEQLLPDEFSQLVAKFDAYLSLNAYQEDSIKRIVVIDSDLVDYSDYDDGQLFYRKDLRKVMQLSSGSLIDYDFGYIANGNYDASKTLEELATIYGLGKTFVLNYTNSNKLICSIVDLGITNQLTYNIFNPYGGVCWQDTLIKTTTLGTIVNGTPNRTFTTKSYVDNAIDTALIGAYKPQGNASVSTLNGLTKSSSMNGYVYNMTDSGNLTNQDSSTTSVLSGDNVVLIWDNGSWHWDNLVGSNYVEKTSSANKVYGTNELGAQTAYTVDDFYDGNIARRDTDGSITVPLTPTQNGHASSKKYVDDEVNDLSNEVDDKLEDKANVDGNYPTLTSGLADNLTPYSEDSGASQENPFISNGTGTNNNTEIVTVGDYGLLQEKQGNTVVVNQFAIYDLETLKSLNTSGTWNNNVYTVRDVTFTIESNKIIINGTATGGNVAFRVTKEEVSQKNILIGGCPKGGNVSTYCFKSSQTFNNIDTGNNAYSVDYSGGWFLFFAYEGQTFNNVEFKPFVIKLSQWFNGDIPTDLQNNPSHFSWYYNGSLAYNTGSLENANGVKLVSTGRNIYNPSETYNVVIPNKPFFASKTTTITYYDKDKNSIGTESVSAGNTFTTPSNCFYINSSVSAITITPYYTDQEGGEGYKDNSNVPIEYPYETPYVVDTGTEILRSAGTIKDIKSPDGTITRKVRVLNLGSLNWSPVNDSDSSRTQGLFNAFMSNSHAKISGHITPKNVICSKYAVGYTFNYFAPGRNPINKSMTINDQNAYYVQDSAFSGYTNAQVKAALNGVYVYVELLNYETEQGTPFAENLPINDYGMLYWLDENDNLVGIPQGAKIFYPTNYKGFVDDMYSRVDGDSSQYVIQSEFAKTDIQWQQSITLVPSGAVLSLYGGNNRIFIKNNILYVEIYTQFATGSGNTMTIADVEITIPEEYGSKIYDVSGRKLTEEVGNNGGIQRFIGYLSSQNQITTHLVLHSAKNKIKIYMSSISYSPSSSAYPILSIYGFIALR